MDPDTIRKIALEVVQLLPGYGWTWTMLLVQVLLTTLAAGIGVYASSYLKIRAQNLATKADFDSLQEQLTRQTESVEAIKSEVSQRDWARREWTNLRRIKLEALLEKMHECDRYLDQYRDRSVIDHKLEPTDPERNPIYELPTIVELYLPELRSEVSTLFRTFQNQVEAGRNLRGEWVTIARAVNDADKVAGDDAARLIAEMQQLHAKALKEYNDAMRPATSEMVRAVGDLRAAARTLLVNIMNVDERPAPSDKR